MDFKDTIKQLADRIEKLKDNIQTEEQLKMLSSCLLLMLSDMMYSIL